jgi:murein L,D-transpeptidase YafK
MMNLTQISLGGAVIALLLAGCATDVSKTQTATTVNPIHADAIRVEKSKRLLTLYRNGQVMKTYHVALGNQPIGPKTDADDGRTPEGHYIIDWHNPKSSYFLSLHVSYPNDKDVAQAAARGVSAGGDIMVHGIGSYPATLARVKEVKDWTAGCISVTDAEMKEIYSLVPDGTPIEIDP